MPSINIPNEELANLLSAQLLSALTVETRDALIEHALKYLITKDSSSYGPKTTPLQEAFDMALNRLANKLADEVVDTPEIREKLSSSLGQLVSAMPEVFDDIDLKAKIFDLILDKARSLYNASR